jgi:hypothetical protein
MPLSAHCTDVTVVVRGMQPCLRRSLQVSVVRRPALVVEGHGWRLFAQSRRAHSESS